MSGFAHDERGADGGMGAELADHAVRVGVRVAARKTDEMHGLLAKREDNLARDVMRAFDEINHDGDVADSLAAIGAEEAGELRVES